jgi:hypothetical protein
MSDAPSYTELKQMRAEAERLAQEAAADRKAAEEDRKAAEYERGQADFRQRTAEDHNRAAGERVRWLEEHDEVRVRALVAAADKALAEAKALKADYDAANHGAAIALVQINEREKAERAAA